MQAEAGRDGAGPKPRVKRVSPESLPENDRLTRVPAMPSLKRPIDAGSSAAMSEMPKGRGFPGSRRK